MIESIEFRLLSPEMIKKLAVVEITKPELYDIDGFPVEGGIMDPRLGVIDPGLRCRTCGARAGECPGHFGYIELVRPVIHVLHAKLIFNLLKTFCSSCGRYLGEDGKKKCPHCGEEQKKIKFEKPFTFREDGKNLTPVEIRERLEKIPDEDLEKIGFKGGRPEWLVLTVLPVPPVTMRPSITLESGDRSEDDLTHKLADIIKINQHLKDNIIIGAPDFIIDDLWELLQYHVATYFDNELAGVPQARHRSGRPLKTLSQRLKTKEGRFRHNLAGKRVNFSARTVISPDPFISINEVGVPVVIAKELTVPETVRKDNIEELKKLVRNADEWPGANYIIRPDGRRKRITKENAEEIAEEISEGYVVERHLLNGDVVLFNRQPSLHRMSMMAHRVRVTPWRTFTLNLCTTPPYNADFDGDEMNLHVPQSIEARTEAELLMEVQRHIRSPRFGGPIIGCKQDHISGNYLLTRKETRLTRSEAFELLCSIGVVPEIKKEKLSGKEVFSYILPEGLNIEFRAKACRGCRKCKKENCEYDCYVVIKNGKLKTGVIDAKAIGGESGRLIDSIEKNFGTEEAHRFIDRVSQLGILYLQKRGFTIGLDDFEISEDARKKISRHIESAKQEVKKLIEKYEKGEIEILPGLTEKQSLEMHILNTLKRVLDVSGEIVAADLPENEAVIMARSGARGGIVQLVQISGCVGQMTVFGERVHRGYRNRTLSHFRPGELSAEAHGFVTNSYKTGENIFEFFFDAMSGREGLMDKSLRTKHSGYMERRLMNALQDLRLEYDMTVRDNRKIIIQFLAGEDGIDPSKSDWGKLDVRMIAKNVVG
ncbi:MAG: DNA-directed RNA polymerase subunit A' [Candidatus Micrarchaeota archaeon]|nr:DNA-directed RNA polymerase subunit A' [Candidatus Micrarchaeota archaeon]